MPMLTKLFAHSFSSKLIPLLDCSFLEYCFTVPCLLDEYYIILYTTGAKKCDRCSLSHCTVYQHYF